jgi:hypothetical protein
MRSGVVVLLALSLHPDVFAGEADLIDVEAILKRFENPDEVVHIAGAGKYAK